MDVSFGEVSVAIVESDNETKFPNILWSYTDFFKKLGEQDTKILGYSITNAFKVLEKEGLPLMRNVHNYRKPEVIQVSVGSPFSYTISRTVNVTPSKPLNISDKYIADLESKSISEARKQLATETFTNLAKLKILAESTVDIKLNGYDTTPPYEGLVDEVSLSQLVSFASTDLVNEIKDHCHRILPGVLVDLDSFMSLYSRIIKKLQPFREDVALLSISPKNIEMIIIRDGVPGTVTSINSGVYDLTRSITHNYSTLPNVAISFLTEIMSGRIKSTDRQREVLKENEAMLSQELGKLFKRVGGTLSIPKNIYIHTEKDLEDFVLKIIETAIQSSTNIKHHVSAVSSDYFAFGGAKTSSRNLCSAYVFHQKLYKEDVAEELYLV